MDEKELFIIKTTHKGEVKFNVMSFEEQIEANANGLKVALENSIMKLGLNIKRKERYASFQSYSNYFFFQILSVSTKKLFLNTLLDAIYTAVYVHVSTPFFIRTFLRK